MGKGINNQVKYVENLIERKLTESELSIFEWAYYQGYEDSQEGVQRERLKREDTK